MTTVSIGVDLGGTNLRVAAYTPTWERLAHIALPTRVSGGPHVVVQDMCQAIGQVLTEVRQRCGAEAQLGGIGIGSPGPLELPAGRYFHPPNLPGFDGFVLKDAVESMLQMPVIVDSDANAAALAEWREGAGKAMPGDSLCMLTLGTGVGSGLILDRKIWHGMNGMGGEAGHVPLIPDGPRCGCGGRGCLEQYASATAIGRLGLKLASNGHAPGLTRRLEAAGTLSARDLAILAREGDPDARQLFSEVGKVLGMGLAGLVNTLNLPLYVIGGGVSSAWELFAPSMFQEMRELSYVYRITEPADHARYQPGKTYVTPAALGSDAGLLGAAMLPSSNVVFSVPTA